MSYFYHLLGNNTPPEPIPSDLEMWLDASKLGNLNGDRVRLWTDASGKGRNGDTGMISAANPMFADTAANGLPALRFQGGNSYSILNFDVSIPEAELFVVMKTDLDPPADELNAGFWTFSEASQASVVPWVDGIIYDSFGSTVRKTTVDPADSMASLCIYNVTTTPGFWANRLNNTLLFSTTDNAVSFPAVPRLGDASPFRFQGHIAEIKLFSSVFSPERRDEEYLTLKTKYGL